MQLTQELVDKHPHAFGDQWKSIQQGRELKKQREATPEHRAAVQFATKHCADGFFRAPYDVDADGKPCASEAQIHEADKLLREARIARAEEDRIRNAAAAIDRESAQGVTVIN